MKICEASHIFQITCLKATPSREVPQTPAPATKQGRDGEEQAALLRVRTGPKAVRAIGELF